MIKEFDKYYKINEYFNSKYKYENIFIEINSLDDSNEIKEYILNSLNPYLNIGERLHLNSMFRTINEDFISTSIKSFYIRLNNKYKNEFKCNYGTMKYYYESAKNDFNHERLFTIHDVRHDFLSNIFKFGVIQPIYNPRKTNKDI